MIRSHKSVDKKRNMVTCVGIGTLVSLIISVLLSVVLTSLIGKGSLNENQLLDVFLIRMIAVLIGGILGAEISNQKPLPVIGVISAAYLLVLLAIGILLFNGTIRNFGISTLSVFAGMICALVIKLKPQRIRKKATRIAR